MNLFDVFSLLILPVAMILFGIIFTNWPPRKISRIYGFRTNLSMKNQQTWDFAQRTGGKKMLVFGLVLLLVSLVVDMLLWDGILPFCPTAIFVLVGVQLLAIISVAVCTQLTLRKHFDANGNPLQA